jgi:mono/diheme cytochrome c family protein
MRSLHWFILLLLLLTVTACGRLALPHAVMLQETLVDTILMERGREVYLENYCGVCHTLTAANTRGTFGPNHDNAGEAAAVHVALDTYRGEASTVEDYIRESLLNPRVFYTPGFEATNHHMPAYTHLPDSDIDALVHLLANQRTATDHSR